MANEHDLTWGLSVDTVGYQQIFQNSFYPPINLKDFIF